MVGVSGIGMDGVAGIDRQSGVLCTMVKSSTSEVERDRLKPSGAVIPLISPLLLTGFWKSSAKREM